MYKTVITKVLEGDWCVRVCMHVCVRQRVRGDVVAQWFECCVDTRAFSPQNGRLSVQIWLIPVSA